MTLVDSDGYWIASSFEETQLRRIRIGDAATIALTGCPEHLLAGRVEGSRRGITDPNAAPGRRGAAGGQPGFHLGPTRAEDPVADPDRRGAGPPAPRGRDGGDDAGALRCAASRFRAPMTGAPINEQHPPQPSVGQGR